MSLSKKSSITACCVTLALSVGTLALPPTALADTTRTPVASEAKVSEGSSSANITGLSESKISKADEFVTQNGSVYLFDANRASSQLNLDEIHKVQVAIDDWNANIKKSQPVNNQNMLSEVAALPELRGEHGYIKAHWWGLEIHVDSYLAGKISGGTATAAGIAGAIGLASSETGVGGIGGEAVAVALGAAAGVQELCRDENGEATYYSPAVQPQMIVCNPLA